MQLFFPKQRCHAKLHSRRRFPTNASINKTVLLIGSLAVTEHIFSSYTMWGCLHSLKSGQDRTRNNTYQVSAIGREVDVGIVCFVYRSGNGACLPYAQPAFVDPSGLTVLGVEDIMSIPFVSL